MARRGAERARLLYDVIDSSDFWQGTADAGSRSFMNVCFRSPSEELDAKFAAEATRAGLDGLKGHRAVGGMRASIYNACPLAAVQALVEFMKEFERRA
jgi:phosphoserine aminotransferase